MAKKKMTLKEKLEEAIVKDVPYEVPENWLWTNIKSINRRISKTLEPVKYNKESFELYSVPSYDDNYPEILYGEEIKSSKYIVDKDEVLLCKINPRINRVWKVNRFTELRTIASSEWIVINPKKFILSEYLLFVLRAPYFRYLLCSSVSGVGGSLTRARPKEVNEYPIPIPPLKEQERIIDKMESLFEKLDNAKELIEEARDDFEKRKSAILEKAFRGELTKEWRKENHIDNNLLELLLSQNNKVKKNFKFSQATELFDLPSNWDWIKLRDCCEKFKYGTSAKSKEEGKVPVLRMGNLQEGKLDWTNLVYTSDEEEINKYELSSGDLLFNRTNSPELVGKTSIYEGKRDAIYAGYLIRVRTLDNVNSKYINYFMNSIFAKHRCMEVKSDGVSQSNINAEKLGDFDIPLPSTEEQKEIVRILDSLLEQESKIEEFTKLEEQIELIKKSILAKAFRGQLGTNCEDEESALGLLKEILNKE